jgi:hypothetical protein
MQPTSQPSGLLTLREKPGDRLATWLRSVAFVDWVMLAFLLFLTGAALSIDSATERQHQTRLMGGMLLGFVAIVLVGVRGNLIRSAALKALLYRVAMFGGTLGSYLAFGRFLPAFNPGTLDQELYQLDLNWFGVEPAMYLDRFVSGPTTEWFSFFYFSYFPLLASHLFPALFACRDERRLSELATGMILISLIGHSLYMVVPGYGPHHAMPELFQNALPSGYWRDLVLSTVATGGALKDIFPSLHTAFPLYLLMYGLRHRRLPVHRYTVGLVGFVTINIIISTMFLRWHYLIDVVAGAALAGLTYYIATRVTQYELKHRATSGVGPSWPVWPQRKAGNPA